ncbi:hypothetical protein CR513_50030, partial [Mucuna pruriens]
MKALERNSTWYIVDKPKDKRAVDCGWIYTVKCKFDGTLDLYKARLVAKMNTVRNILFLTAHNNFMLKMLSCMDWKRKSIWRFSQNGVKNKVCKLKKVLYGLKQSPRTWFGRFTQLVNSMGYKQSGGNDEIKQLALKESLTTQFGMKELGKLKYFLGIVVAYSRKDIFISQRKYVLDLLKETKKLGCKTIGLPIEQNHKVGSEESPPIEVSILDIGGKTNIFISHKRPDIAYAISVVSQFMHNPHERHFQPLEIYTDVDYVGSITDRRSTFVTWRSKKQNIVDRSSVEAAFRAMTHDICDRLWTKIILDLKVKHEGPMKLL